MGDLREGGRDSPGGIILGGSSLEEFFLRIKWDFSRRKLAQGE